MSPKTAKNPIMKDLIKLRNSTNGRFILHIGLHKTGTTFFQNTIFPNISNIVYLGKTKNKKFIYSNDINKHQKKTFLYSNESLSGSLKDSYKPETLSWGQSHLFYFGLLNELNPAGIILSLRSPKQWVWSIYAHYLEYGYGALDFKSFMGLEGVSPVISIDDLRCFNKLSYLNNNYPNKVFPFILEEAINPQTNESFLQSLASFLNINRNDINEGLFKNKPLNKGLNQPEAARLRTINNILYHTKISSLRAGKKVFSRQVRRKIAKLMPPTNINDESNTLRSIVNALVSCQQ